MFIKQTTNDSQLSIIHHEYTHDCTATAKLQPGGGGLTQHNNTWKQGRSWTLSRGYRAVTVNMFD